MASENYMEFNETELFNVSRTSKLAAAMGINTLRLRRELVNIIQSRFVGYGFGLGGFGTTPFGGPENIYGDITQAPWYDAGVPASLEFAGVLPLAMQGLDDSSYESSVTEYISNGGNTGKSRNATQSFVASVAIVAKSERGAEYGKRWLARMLAAPSVRACSGADLTYYRYDDEDAPRVHRRDVALTRGVSVTRKKASSCSATWLATFTLTAGDPFEYGDLSTPLTRLGYGQSTTGTGVVTSGTVTLINAGCPVYSYDPIYDPLIPALVPSPTAPNFLPSGWTIVDGLGFRRAWARVTAPEPSEFLSTVLIKVRSSVEARMVRISIFPTSFANDAQCDPLFSAVVAYLPPNADFYLDGEQQAAYTWDGASDYVRRTDSLVYSPEGNPVEWAAFEAGSGLLVTVDTFATSSGYQGDGGNLAISLSLIAKSD